MRISPPRGHSECFCVSERGWYAIFSSADNARKAIQAYPGTVLAMGAALILPKFATERYRAHVAEAKKEIQKYYNDWERGAKIRKEEEKQNEQIFPQ